MSQSQVVERTAPNAITVFRDRLLSRRVELGHALEGSGIGVDRFIRTAVTAAQSQPELISDVSFPSLWTALLKACRDRLLPDGRQGAIVPFKRTATWVPMYRGLIDRFEQSGEYRWITANIHRDDDHAWDLWIDESGQHFLHRPGPGLGKVIETYAAAITKSGAFFISVVSEPDMVKIRNVSRTTREDSPWNQWTDQMRLKTAIRRLCKMLPMPQELDDLIASDESIEEPAAPAPKLARPRGATNALEQFAGEPEQPQADSDAPADKPQAERDPLIETARERGKEAKRTGMKRTALPGEYREAGREAEVDAWRQGWDSEPLTGGDDGRQ